jgi:hypothetical protein
MDSNRLWTSLVAGACGVCAAVANAQPPTPPAPPDTVFFVQNVAPLPAFGGQIDIIRHEGDVLGPVVEGKPYSAKSITESTQMLADGNRITQRNESTIHRDSKGRTRREQTLGGVGPWQAGEPVTTINIHDPVADKTYMLDPTAQTARELRPFQMAFAEVHATFDAPVAPPPPGVGAGTSVTVVRRTESTNDVHVFSSGAVGATPPIFAGAAGAYEPGEDLGEQVLEGLLVQGTRTTDTIPAGAMGNERPIEIVTERWYSKDIDALVLQRFFDPRFGETIYRLVNVVRGEPSPDLFQVPQGYALEVTDGPEARALSGTRGQRVEFRLQREDTTAPQ